MKRLRVAIADLNFAINRQVALYYRDFTLLIPVTFSCPNGYSFHHPIVTVLSISKTDKLLLEEG